MVEGLQKLQEVALVQERHPGEHGDLMSAVNKGLIGKARACADCAQSEMKFWGFRAIKNLSWK